MAPLPYDTNALIAKSVDLLNRVKTEGVTQNGVQIYPPSTPTSGIPPITSASLTPQTPLNFQSTPQTPVPIVAPLPTPSLALTQQEQGAIDQVSPYQQLIAQLQGGTSELAQKSFRQQQSESLGLNAATNLAQSLYDKNQSLDLRAQAIQAQKQADIQGLQNSAQMGGANVTKGGLDPQRRAIETRANQQSLENTLAKLDNAVSYYAALGKVREATQAVDQAVDAEFTPKLLALDTAQRNLNMLLQSPDLTAAQEKRALNRQAELTAQQDKIKEQAQLKKDTGDARIKALTNNPNMTQLQHDAISAAQSPEEVAALINYFGLSSLTQQEKFNQELQTAKFNQDERQFGMNYALQQQKFAEEKRQFGITSQRQEQELAQKAAEVNIDPSQILAYAQEYAASGKIPTGIPKGAFGIVSQIAKEAPKQEGEIVSSSTGVKPATDSTYADALSNLSSVVKLAQTLKEQDKNRIGGVLSGTLGAITGSESQGQYLSTRQQIVDLLSRARSGAALTEQEVKTYEGMLPGRFSEPFGLGQNSETRIQNFIDTLTQDLTNKSASKGWSIYGVSKIKLDDGNEYTVGQTINNAQGQKGRVNADGSITLL